MELVMLDWITILQNSGLFLLIAVVAFFLLGWLFPALTVVWAVISALGLAVVTMVVIVALSKI